MRTRPGPTTINTKDTDVTETLATELITLPFTTEDPELAPRRAHETDAGWDLRASEDVFLEPGEYCPVPTGVYAAVPTGFSLDIRPRSGLAAKHGVTVLNTPGTVDAGYRGEIKVILINHSREDSFIIRRGDRIAQALLNRLVPTAWQLVEDLDETDRGAGGFGSTGVN